MVKHNNVIPNVHLRKHWQRNVRVWLNQAGRKGRRLEARRAKAATIAPRPLDRLRPSVRCQTIRYNHRPRLGKGFTLAEIKSVGLGVAFAKSVGINVDHRRKNRSQEGFEANKARLTNYLSKLVLHPRHESHYVTKAKSGILNDTPKVKKYQYLGSTNCCHFSSCQHSSATREESQICESTLAREVEKDQRLQVH